MKLSNQKKKKNYLPLSEQLYMHLQLISAFSIYISQQRTEPVVEQDQVTWSGYFTHRHADEWRLQSQFLRGSLSIKLVPICLIVHHPAAGMWSPGKYTYLIIIRVFALIHFWWNSKPLENETGHHMLIQVNSDDIVDKSGADGPDSKPLESILYAEMDTER